MESTAALAVAYGSISAASSSAIRPYGVASPLQLGCGIFLSHSGKNKSFVEFLHRALAWAGYSDVFFDQETLPKAGFITMDNILWEARSARLGVLVLSDAFFTNTTNPMRELAEFIEFKVPLLPLFYKLTAAEVKDEGRQAEWKKQWSKWVADGYITEDVVKKWTEALRSVARFNGVEFHKVATTKLQYIDRVVEEIRRILTPPPALFEKEAKLKGMARQCQVVNAMYERAMAGSVEDVRSPTKLSSSKPNETPVVAIYGFPSIGKSTLCKAMCIFYNRAFKGRVCRIDLGCPEHNNDRSHHMNYQLGPPLMWQLENLLGRHCPFASEPLLLAIDNVQEHSKEEAGRLLSRYRLPKGSKIFITSRSPRLLERLTVHYKFRVIECCPSLLSAEAKGILMEAAFGWDDTADQRLSIMNQSWQIDIGFQELSIRSCRSSPLYKYHILDFHPKLLQEVGECLAYDHQAHIDTIYEQFSEAYQQVFRTLDTIYEQFSEKHQTWFIDSCICVIEDPWQWWVKDTDIVEPFEWLQSVYSLGRKDMEQFGCATPYEGVHTHLFMCFS